MSCPGDDTVICYLEGRLQAASRASVEHHVDRCAQCRQLVAALVRSTRRAARGSVPVAVHAGSPAVGDRIARYEVVSFIGRGSMGVVVAARDPVLRREVALKLLDRRLGLHAERLREEARALAALRDPNVVTVYDAGEADGRMFIAMEWVRGPTLRAWLIQRPRRQREILDVFAHAGRGLLAAHAAGIVHRDFKPDNVFIDGEGRVRVGDFGLALGAGQAPSFTGEGEGPPGGTNVSRWIAGTPAYMAPEQLAGAEVDARADQFAFCVALWEALAGTRPFHGSEIAGLSAAIAAGVDTRALVGVDPTLRRALARGLAHDARHRHPSLRAVIDAMQLRPRRSTPLVVVGAATTALVAIGFGLSRPASPDCAEDMTAEWSQRRERLRADLEQGMQLASRETLARSAIVSVDEYVDAWASAHTAVCEGTDVDDTTLRCLSELRGRLLHALPDTGAITETTALVLAWTVDAMPAPLRCQEPGWTPPIAADESSVAAARQTLARAHVLEQREEILEGLALAEVAQRQVEGLDEPRLAAQVKFHRAALLADAGRVDEARAEMEAAFWMARRLNDDRLAAMVALQLLPMLHGDREAVLLWAGHAEAAVRRTKLSRAPLHVQIGLALDAVGELEAALEHFQRALVIIEDDGYVDTVLAATAKIDMARTLTALRRWDEAVDWFGQATELLSDLGEDDTLRTAAVRVNLAANLANSGRYSEALEPGLLALYTFEERLPPNHPNLATTLNGAGIVALELGQLDRSIDYLTRALEIEEAIEGPGGASIIQTLDALGKAWSLAGDPLVGWSLHRRALSIATTVHGPDHPAVAGPYLRAGQLLLDVGEPEAAEREYARAVAIHRESEGDDAIDTATTRALHAWALLRIDPLAAHAELDAVIGPLRATLGEAHPTVGDTLRALAEAEHAIGDVRDATAHRERGLAVLRASLPADHPLVRRASVPLGSAHLVPIALPSAGDQDGLAD